MKSKIFNFLLAGTAALIFATSCEESEVEVTGISIDKDSVEVAVESTVELVATIEPEDATGEITWSSSDPSVAAVVDGIVTGLKVGEVTVSASTGAFSATCDVTVTPKEIDPNELPESLKGSNYHVILLDETSYGFIQEKVDQDLRPDEENKFLYVWEETYTPGTPTGLNFYGQTEEWVSLVVASKGWSGAGFFVGEGYGMVDFTDMYNNPEDYVFHAGFKSAQESTSYLLKFRDGNSFVGICIGANEFVDGNTTYQPYTDFPRDNEWHSVEIPVTKLNELGLFYDQTFTETNVLEMLAGATTGTTLDMDAVFFYKKSE